MLPLPLENQQAGNKDEGLMFLLTDSQITNERFLIYINDLLASGNIPDLFAMDEVDTIVSGKYRAHGVFWMESGCLMCYLRI